MSFSNAFWVEVWSTPYFSLGSHFLFLLTLFPCCFPSEFVTLFRRAVVGCVASVVCSASAWPASDFSHSGRGQTFVKLCELRLILNVLPQAEPESSWFWFRVISYTTRACSQPANATQKRNGVNLPRNNFLISEAGAGGSGETKTPAIIRQVHPSARHLLPSQRFQWTQAFYAYRRQGNTLSSWLLLFPWFALPTPHFFLGSPSE